MVGIYGELVFQDGMNIGLVMGFMFGFVACYCLQFLYEYMKLKASRGEKGVAGGSAGDGRSLSQSSGQGNHQAQRLRPRNPESLTLGEVLDANWKKRAKDGKIEVYEKKKVR